jgi:hypothetical protein
MRDAGKITVQRAIVHMIDHLGEKLTRSNAELPLAANERVRNYFSGRVAKALADDTTGSARFVSDGAHAAKACYGLLGQDPPFVDLSQQLAQLLMEAMGTNKNISPGDLAVCLYTAENYPSKTFLALIKLDPGTALLQKAEPGMVTLEVLENVLPTEGEQLQKAALVPLAGTYDEFDLLLLDRQVPEVAAFWAKTFLGTMPARDAPTSTEIFYKVIQDVTKQLRKQPPKDVAPITVEESTALLAQRDHAMRRNKISLPGFAARASLKDDARGCLDERLKRAFPEDKTIEIDKASAEKLLTKRRFRGEHGVLFEVDFKHKDKVVTKVEDIVTVDGETVTEVILHVTDFQWVK